jgi:hypothetical protein
MAIDRPAEFFTDFVLIRPLDYPKSEACILLNALSGQMLTHAEIGGYIPANIGTNS